MSSRRKAAAAKDDSMKQLQKEFNLYYGSIHGSYWLLYGILCSFSSVFLLARGYSNAQIGMILASGNILAVLVQPFLADIADRSRRFTIYHMMAGMVVLLMVLSGLLYLLKEPNLLTAVIYVLAFAWMMILQPFCNAANRNLEETGVFINFGACRSVGSFCYAVMMLFLGELVLSFGADSIQLLGEVILVIFLIIILSVNRAKNRAMAERRAAGETAAAPGRAPAAEPEHEEITIRAFLGRHRLFLVVCLGVLGVYFTNSVLNTYMAQIVDNVGGNSADTGRIFSLLAFMEIPTLVLFERLHRKFSCASMLKFSAAAFVLWVGICLIARNVGTILAAQLVQPFSFALFLPAMVRFIDDTMSKGEAVKGQTMFTTMTTVAAIFASLAGGVILDQSGPRFLLLVSTIVTIAGTVIIFLSVDKAGKEGQSLS